MRTAYPFQFGTVFLEWEDDMLTGLSFKEESHSISENEIASRTEFTDLVIKQIEEYLQGTRQTFDIKYRLAGTEFQRKVWKALLEIHYGETRSYKQIAEAIGKPNASRAVGMANSKNPILLLVPCHRVIGAEGSLTGYAGGLEMKQYLLNLERGIYYAAQNERIYPKEARMPPLL